jgi:hypothetical protein
MIKSRMRWAGHVAHMGKMKNAYNILAGKPEGKRLLGRPMHKEEDNIRLDLGKVGWQVVGWMHLAQERYHWWD